jgi:DeoR/GlpR family transcriptional regulator of sugar metabolism
LLVSERRERIKEYLIEHRTATAKALATMYNVSHETIRRDFAELEKEGFLTRSYGGASVNQRVMSSLFSTADRTRIVRSKKRTIVERVFPYLRPNDCIFIDHSTTAATLCEVIRHIPLTVVTNSLLVINSLANAPKINLNCTGGNYNSFHNAFFGPSTLDYIRSHKVDKAFVSCRTVHLDGGLFDNSELESELRYCVIQNASSTFLLVDNSKINRFSFVATAPIDAVDYMVTDEEVPSEWHNLSENLGMTIIDKDYVPNERERHSVQSYAKPLVEP